MQMLCHVQQLAHFILVGQQHLCRCNTAQTVNSRFDEIAALARKPLPLESVQPKGHNLPGS
jgi:hypothetical protein